MHKMSNGLTPRCLALLIPPSVYEVSMYGLRNQLNVYKPNIRKGYVLHSFVWTSVNDWNQLSINIRQSPTLQIFKDNLRKKIFYKGNKLFNYGVGHGALSHARIRMGLSALNCHRKKYNFIRHNTCPLCGNKPENEVHFFLKCPDLVIQRTVLMGTITPIIDGTVNFSIPTSSTGHHNELVMLLLYGCPELNYDQNILLFSAVQIYITQSHRFM
jgi:hypothetical protein